MKHVLILSLFALFVSGCDEKPLPVAVVTEQDIERTLLLAETKAPADTLPYVDFEYDRIYAFASVFPFDYQHLYKKMDVSQFHDTINRMPDQAQTKYLLNILNGKLNRDTVKFRAVADCFYPRHNIIFVDKKDSVLHFVSVCFECGNIIGSKSSKASLENFEDFFNAIGLRVFERPDQYKVYYDSLATVMGRKKRVNVARHS